MINVAERLFWLQFVGAVEKKHSNIIKTANNTSPMFVLQFKVVVLVVYLSILSAFPLRWSSKGTMTCSISDNAVSRQHLVALRSTMDDVNDMTVIQLKTALKQRGLPVSGVKEELKKRLLSDDRSGDASDVDDDEILRVMEQAIAIDDEKGAGKSQKQQVERNQVVSRQERQEERKRVYNAPTGGDSSNIGRDESGSNTASSSTVKRGDPVRVEILRYGPLGASVKLLPDLDTSSGSGSANALLGNDWVDKTGLILQDHIQYWSAVQGRDPEIGEVCDAFIEKVRDDGKLDIAFRPRGYSKVLLATSQILKSLEASGGRLAVGARTTPEQIWSMWPGMSKGEYKTGIGALLRDGTVVTTDHELTLVPVKERVPLPAQVGSRDALSIHSSTLL